MNIAASAQPVASWLVGTARHVLGKRLRSLVVYGSAATGDVVRDFSDIDLLLIVEGDVTLQDAFRLQELARSHDPAPFAYVQPTFMREGAEVPLLVPGTFAVLYGAAPAPASIQSDDDLRRNGADWLTNLPGLLRSDGVAWSFATVDVHRRARLALTRLKPAIRALLVQHGESPQRAWATSWEQALATLENVDSTLTSIVRNALDVAHVAGADGAPEVGRAGLLALERVCDSHLGNRSTNGTLSLLRQ